ncbi:MAG: S8 family serine peptidase [Ilumatobacteraceae bacterium]
MRKYLAGAASVALAVTGVAVGAAGVGASEDPPPAAPAQEFVVLYAAGVDPAAARAAVEAAGGTIVNENAAVGVATVTASNADFQAAAAAQPALDGTAENRIIGEVPPDAVPSGDAVTKFDSAEADLIGAVARSTPSRRANPRAAEPLADWQWDMQQIGATAEGSYRYNPGNRGVRVGILDTGVDGTHPDIAPNFDGRLSRNFTEDVPVDANGDPIDGPCEDEPDQSCEDPNDVDEDGHGTHVASTVAGAINGLGIAGVAPKVTIVNLRAGQDSGYFFLQPSVDALTYAGDIGIDVVNMSYYVDPWLFNCATNPADSPEDRLEQQTIVEAMQRALDYAHDHGVTLISAAGNGATDYTKVLADASSPDFASEPGEAAYSRTIAPDDCTSMPSEGEHVISVSATGISKRKSYYSDYGNGYIDIAAPGGDVYDTPTNTRDLTKATLAGYPEALGRADGTIDENGEPTNAAIVKDCDASGTCAYYQWLQGTSMASPHAVGVAALIVSKYGERDRVHGGLGMDPDDVEQILRDTATPTPCPTPAAFTYTRILPAGNTVTATHTCEGDVASNGFYGSGIVNALHASGK